MRSFILLFALCTYTSTPAQPTTLKVSPSVIVSGELPAGSAFFTNNHKGEVVLCWTSGDKATSQVFYTIYNKKSETFGNSIAVTPSKGTSIHGESMNKVAFRKDGTVVAVYERKHPTEKNKYAGSIFYSQSFDNGKSWTKEKYLHTDTLREYGRSYFDITTLNDGEVGAVWLDGRMKNGNDGTSLFFAKTKNKIGFQTDQLIGATVCQCCRTDLYADPKGNTHILYRDIESTLKGQVRDFAHIVSSDNGLTFSQPKKISEDKWVIAGCPHTGASIAGDQDKIEMVWFTAGGTSGLYYTSSDVNGNDFKPRQLISEGARHPQLVGWGNQSALVWEESVQTLQHNNHEHTTHTNAESMGNIILALRENTSGNIKNKIVIDDGGGEFPVIIAGSVSEIFVAYSKEQQIFVRRVSR